MKCIAGIIKELQTNYSNIKFHLFSGNTDDVMERLDKGLLDFGILILNVWAVYTEEEYHCKGIAGEMLSFVCKDMKSKDIDTLYLITDHTSFYERYGWEFLCMVQGDGEPDMTRMYIHKS